MTATLLTLVLLAATDAGEVVSVDQAIERVKQIVNQPVTSYPRKPDQRVGVYQPGWFHLGARVPDFRSVDIRRTQEFPYSRFEWVTSDLNPGLMFRSQDLEFNAMTKYFYTDRSLPKKRLSEAEMIEINKLYRIIATRPRPTPAPRLPLSSSAAAPASTSAAAVPVTRVALGLGSVAALVLALALRVHRRRRTAGR